MKIMYRTICVAVVSVGLVLPAGCVGPNGQRDNTGTGALTGGAFGALTGALIGGPRHAAAGALIGGLSGLIAGGFVGHMMDQDQRQQLQRQSPQTLQVIQHNDAVYQQQQTAAKAQTSGQAPQAQTQAPPTEPLTPLTVDDIKALDSIGLKKEAIIAAIERSKSVYTQADIAALQQSNPNIDPAVIEYMKKNPS